MADSSTQNEINSTQELETHEIEKSRDLFEQGMQLGYEKMDLERELEGLRASGASDENPQFQQLKVNIALLNTQISSLATQWAERKVPDFVKNPERREKRMEYRREHFLARLERKLKRNGRKIDRYEKSDENSERGLNKKLGRWERRDARRDARQEARGERREGRGSERRQGRWESREVRRDARQERRADRRKDRLERKMDRTGDRRDERSAVYNNAEFGAPGSPWNANNPSYSYRGDQNSTDAFDQGGIEGGYRQDQLGTNPDSPIVLKLRAANLDPSVLLSSDVNSQMEAVRLVYADDPKSIAYFEDALSQPEGSSDRQEALVELRERHGELSQAYEVSRDTNLALRQLDQTAVESNLWNKFKNLSHEFTKSPAALVAVGACLLGLFLARKQISEATKNYGHYVGYAALAVAGIATGDIALKTLSKSHQGIFDRLGFHPTDLLSNDVLESYRTDYFPSMPQEDRQSVDDMMRLLNTPMTAVNDSFEAALNSHTLEIKTDVFLGKGVDSKQEGAMDGKSLYKGLSWFYMECAERAALESGKTLPEKRDERLRMGLAYAKKNYAGMTFNGANYKLNLEDKLKDAKLIQATGPSVRQSPSSRGPEKVVLFKRSLEKPRGGSLRELASQSRNFAEMVWELPAGQILVKGYPWQYRFSDQGQHVFVDVLDPQHIFKIPSKLQAGALEQQVSTLISESELTVNKRFSAVKGSLDSKLSYRPSGEWTLVPALDRMSHEGLDPTLSSEKIPFVFYGDQDGFHMTFDGAKNNAGFQNIETLKKAYELERVLPDLVRKDIDHLLFGLRFSVEDFTDAAGTTTLKIRYDSGYEGTLVYKGGHLESVVLAESAALRTQWEKQASKDTAALFARSPIQERIVGALGIAPDVYARWNNTMTTGLVSSEPNIEFNSGLFGTAGKTFMDMFEAVVNSNDVTGSRVEARQKSETEAAIDKGLGDLIVVMHQDLFELYKKNYSKVKFDAEKTSMMKEYENKIIAIVGSTVDSILLSEDIDRMKAEAEAQTAEALAPMKHLLNSEAYEKKLAEAKAKTLSEIDALGDRPHKSQVDKVIEENRRLASKEANEYRGLSTDETAARFNAEKLTGAHEQEWKGPSEQVYSYLSERFDLQPGIVNELMDMYFAKIEFGDATPSKDYAFYFLSEVYTIMGGRGSFMEHITELVSDEYATHKAALQGIKSCADWSLNPEIRPGPEGTESTIEDYRNQVQKDFTDWFAKEGNPGALTKLDGDWPQKYELNVMDRASVLINSAPDRATLDRNMITYKKMVRLERYGVLEHMIANRIELNKPLKLELFSFFQYTASKHLDPAGIPEYAKEIRSFMLKHYIRDLSPNFGVPYY